MIEWVDFIGRWMIIGFGVGFCLSLLGYGVLILSNFLIKVFGQYELILDYMYHQREFKVWKQEQKELREQEKKETRALVAELEAEKRREAK